MKTNRTQYFANRNMRRKGDSKKRREQVLAAELIAAHLPIGYIIEMEYVPKLERLPNEAVDFTDKHSPHLDIAILNHSMRIALRLNGEYHDRVNQSRYDFAQKVFLEHQPQKWTVIDFTKDNQRRLFKTHDSEPTEQEAIQIYYDMREALEWILPELAKIPNINTIRKILKKIHR